MAFVNLNNVQFYQKPPSKPSTQKPRNALPRDNFRVAFVTNSGSQPAPLHNKADPTFKRDCQPKWSIGITRRQGHDLALQHEGDKAGAQGCTQKPTSPYSKGDENDSPTAEEPGLKSHRDITGSCLSSIRLHIDNSESNGDTQDSPIILGDNEPDLTESETMVESGGSSNTDSTHHDPNPYTDFPTQDLSTGLGKPINLSGPWYDVKDGCYVYEEPPKGHELELHVGSTSTPVPCYRTSPCHSPRPPHLQIKQKGRITLPTTAKLTDCHFPTLLDVADGGASDEHTPQCASNSHLGVEEQGNSSLATALGLPEPHGSAETPQPQTDKETNDDGEIQGQRKEKRTRRVEAGEWSSGSQLPESSDCPDSAKDEGNEDLPLAKRKKRVLVPTENLTPSREQSPMPYIRRPDTVATTPSETDDMGSQAGHEHPLSVYDLYWEIDAIQGKEVVDGEVHYWVAWQPTLEPKRALKCAKPQIDEFEKRCQAQLKPKNESSLHSKIRAAGSRSRAKRVPWTPEEDATVLKMKRDGCPWEEIHAALPHRSKGTIQVRYSTKLKR